MKTVLSCAVAVTLLGGCIFVKVREHDAQAGGPAAAPLEAASSDSCSASTSGGESIKAAPVASHAIGDIPGKTLTSILLTVPPHATANAHRHAGVVFGYVIEGMICSQITGDADLRPYRAGESFFEPPGSQHLAFVNPEAVPARILVTQVADTGATLTMPLR